MPPVFFLNLQWMGWNLFLAAVPLALSFPLFAPSAAKRRGPPFRAVWAAVFLVYYLFLPNAPYVLTDVIRMILQIKNYRYYGMSDTFMVLGLLPQYGLFMLLGFSCYTVAFGRQLRFLERCGWPSSAVRAVRFLNPAVMAVGIYLGRVHRFNTWDVLSRSDEIVATTIEGFRNAAFFSFLAITSGAILLGHEILTMFFQAVRPVNQPPLTCGKAGRGLY
jgi:uncharacterized membrane protein